MARRTPIRRRGIQPDFRPLDDRQLAGGARRAERRPSASRRGYAGFSVAGFTALAIGYAGNGVGDGAIRRRQHRTIRRHRLHLRPDPGDAGGDVFFGPSGAAPVAGNYDYFIILHETRPCARPEARPRGDGFGALPAASTASMEYR